MAISNQASTTVSEFAQPVASIQPMSFNDVNFKKTNLYDNNDAHKAIIDFAQAKAKTNKLQPDEKGITLVDVNGYSVRIYGEKPALNTKGHTALT